MAADTLKPGRFILGPFWHQIVARDGVLHAHRPILWLTVAAGLLAALAESAGLGLFLPLLELLTPGHAPSASSPMLGTLTRWLMQWPEQERLYGIATLMALTAVLRSALLYATQVLFGFANNRVAHALRLRVMSRQLQMPLIEWEKPGSEGWMNLLAWQTWRAAEAVSHLLRLVVAGGAMLIQLGLLAAISWRLTLAIAVAFSIFWGLIHLVGRAGARWGPREAQANDEMLRASTEIAQNMLSIRAYGEEARAGARFRRVSQALADVIDRLHLVRAVSTPSMELFASVTIVALLLITRWQGFALSEVLVFVFVFYRIQPRAREIGDALIQLRSLASVFDDLAPALAHTDPSRAVERPRVGALQTALVLDHVSFAHDDQRAPAVHELCLSVPAGKTTAIVGPSGAGKSTVLKLLMGLYAPHSGAVRWDDTDLASMAPQALRTRTALVPQKPQLLDASIEDNILFGLQGCSHAEVEHAARQADAHDFITALPQGYATAVGGQSDRLSGGQAQRIALARALLRQPELIILDEATNALDARSDQAIHQALRTLAGSLTMVIVAHRLRSVDWVDHVIVLDHGRVVQQGAPATLAAEPGLFSQLLASG